MRTQQRRLHEHTVFQFQVVNHHIIIIGVLDTEGIVRVVIVEAKVAIAISIGERNDTFSTESAVRVEQISKALILYRRLNGIFYRFLTRESRQDQTKQPY